MTVRSDSQSHDVIILGGGAAGLMCAIAAGRRGRSVLVLEGSNRIGKKILMSGGGRCNFTNLHCEPSRFISANPHFCISALKRYTQWDFIALVEQHGIAYHDKGEGQLFCDESSKEIVAMLQDECDAAGVKIRTNSDIRAVTRVGDEAPLAAEPAAVHTAQISNGADRSHEARSGATVVTSAGDTEPEAVVRPSSARFSVATAMGTFTGESLVIATGGLSIPKMGASDFGYRLARQFGLNVLETRAALVPFTFTGVLHEMTDRLSGVSLRATLATEDRATSFTDSILFTHRGLSGPAALQLSSYWQPGERVRLNLLPDIDAQSLLTDAKSSQPAARVRTVLGEVLPRALVLELQALWWPSAADARLAEVSNDRLRELAGKLHDWHLKPAATEGYRTAEVTLGGIDTDELSSRTLECKRVPGLYCIGEVVDVTGHLGGFNFQWAWSSAQAAGQVV